MKHFLFTCLMFVVVLSLGQSKKEQIRLLTSRVDSLTLVIIDERSDNIKLVEQLNKHISQLEENVRGLEIKLKEKGSENETNKKQIEELRKLINIKSDSLMVLKVEVEKLKPTPEPVVQNNPVDVTPSGPYKTVTIGNQVWMKENLNVSTFRNGDPIPEAKTAEEWQAAGTEKQPAWCYYDNDPKNGVKYGKLYNWYAVNDARGLAPVGYHVPTDEEWSVLIGFLGNDVLKKMKSTSGWNNWTEYLVCTNCKNWNEEYRKKTACHVCQDTRYHGTKLRSGNGTNSSGFSGLPGGKRDPVGPFSNQGDIGEWWSASASEYRSGSAYYLQLFQGFDLVSSSSASKGSGFSVRCLKD